jgi:hypothetical protein
MVAGGAPRLASVQITEYPTVALFEKHMNIEHDIPQNSVHDLNELEGCRL